MGIYIQEQLNIPTGLDEAGVNYGLIRLEKETLGNYRRRLLLEARVPSGPGEREFIFGTSRRVGLLDIPVFFITLIPDPSDNTKNLATSPRIVITSTKLYAYHDFKNNQLDFELNLVDRNKDYWLSDVYAAFNTSTYFDIEILDANYSNRKSQQLMYGSTERYVQTEILLESPVNKLRNGNLKAIYPEAAELFQNELGSVSAIAELGDYYVDYTNGVLFTYEPMRGFLSYTYDEFPYVLFWQQVKTWPYRDVDKMYRVKDTILDDLSNTQVHKVLNQEGAKLANHVLKVHGLTWGE